MTTTDPRAAAEEALRLHEAATPGDLAVAQEEDGWGDAVFNIYAVAECSEEDDALDEDESPIAGFTREADAKFHERARTLLPILARAVIEGLDAIKRLTSEREEARDWVRRLTHSDRVLTCAFCGGAYPPGTPESNDASLTAHIGVCQKHPMREVERERDAARAEVARLEARAKGAEEAVAKVVRAAGLDVGATNVLITRLLTAMRGERGR